MQTGNQMTSSSTFAYNVTTSENIQAGYYQNVSLFIWKTVPPIIIPLGSLGNTLTIIVILRHFRKMTSISLFLLCLAFSDLLVLYTVCLRHWIRNVWKFDIRSMSESGCKLHVFFTYVSMQLSSWLLVGVTTEKVISVVVPHRVKFICTSKTVKKVIGVIILLILGLNCHILYGMGLKPTTNLGNYDALCYARPGSYENFFYTVWPWIDFCVMFAVPFFILICSNIIIISRLAIHKKRWRSIKGEMLFSGDKDNKRITFLLIWLCVFFFVCLTPSGVYFIVSPYWRDGILEQEQYENVYYDLEYMAFWYAIINCVSYLNATCNFIFYVLTGTRFRREIINLIRCKRSPADGVFGYYSRRTTRSRLSGPLHVKFRTSQREMSVTVVEMEDFSNSQIQLTKL